MGAIGEKYSRVVLWGAGAYGGRVYQNLRIHWNDCVEVKGLADNNIILRERVKNGEYVFGNELLNSEITEILALEDVKKMYQQQLIDGVVIGVGEKYYDEIYKQLIENDIEILEYPNPELVSINDIQVEQLCFGEENILVHILENVYVVEDNCEVTTWIYDERGRCVKEVFNYKSNYENIKSRVPFDITENAVVIEEDVCILSNLWLTNYWHFMYEGIDKILVLENNGYHGKYMVYDRSYIRELMELLKIEDHRIVWVKENASTRYKCKRAWKFEGINGLNGRTTRYLCEWSKKLVEEKCVDYELEEKDYAKRVFVKRIGERKLVGSEKVLEKYGFTTMIPEDLSVLEQIRVFYMADIIVCPHGANSSNVVFMREGTSFIELFGSSYINPCCMHAIRRNKIKYHMLVERRDILMPDRDWLSDYKINDLWLETVIETALGN